MIHTMLDKASAFDAEPAIHTVVAGEAARDPYLDFLATKAVAAPLAGFEIDPSEVNSILKPHQRDCVVWAVRGGRRALFEAFGLGKTLQQLEILRLILSRAGGRGLIVAPLGVRREFRRDAAMLGLDIRFIRSVAEADATGLYITNYETVRDGKLDPNEFTAVSLDEAAILRSYGSLTFQRFLTLFEGVRYRFVATAMPSPNRHKELIHYAGFLGVMDTGQALTRFFQRNSEKAGDLTLYPHKEAEFWAWLSTWAVFLTKPSDLGYPDDGYDLPPLRVHWHEVKTDLRGRGFDDRGQGLLLKDPALSLSATAAEKRDRLPARIEKMLEIVASAPDAHCLIWHDLEAERHAIDAALPEAVAVYGSQDLECREAAVTAFAEGRIKHLAAKPVMLGAGTNLQPHCHTAIFLGIGFKAHDFVQAIHRIYRFLQHHAVDIHIIYAESEREVRRALETKWAQHDALAATMSALIREHGLARNASTGGLLRSLGVERKEAAGNGWLIAHNDTVDEARCLPEASLDLIITSIPFSNHYEYTPSFNDFGHTDNNDHFWRQMDFLTPELLRALKPGRLACVHVKDRVLFGSVTGAGIPTISPFHCEAVFHYRKHGFDYCGMITVVTDVVRENNATYRLGYTEMRKDGTKMGVGCPEYILLLHKPQSDRSKGFADAPVSKEAEGYSLARWQLDAHALWRSSGNRLLPSDEFAAILRGQNMSEVTRLYEQFSLGEIYDHEYVVQLGEALGNRLPKTFMALAPASAHPAVWHDVARMRTLNGAQSAAGRELHVCPLQLDIIERLVARFSAVGETVYDPFGGLMSVPYVALKAGRIGRGVELHAGYFRDGTRYLEAAEREIAVPTLFDLMLDAAE